MLTGLDLAGRAQAVRTESNNKKKSAMIEITSPTSGEKWSVGSRHYITFKTTSNVQKLIMPKVSVEYSVDGGKKWQAIAAAIEYNDNQYLWTVPDAVSAQCKIRITDPGRTADSGESQAFAIIPSREKTYHWTLVTNQAAFAPRDGAGALVFKNRMWLIGGWNPRDRVSFPRVCNNEVWSSQDGASWQLEKKNSFLDSSFDPRSDWEGRHTVGYVVYKDKMWIVGGDPIQDHYQNDVWNTPDGIKWTEVTANVPWKDRILHYTLVYNGKIWVMGGEMVTSRVRNDVPGWKEPSPDIYYNDVWNTTDGVKWTRVTEHAPWQPRGLIGGSVVFANRMWIVGGSTYYNSCYADVWSSSDGINWQRHVERAPWNARFYHDVAVFDGRMWLLEGCFKGNQNDVWYSADGINWYEVPGTPWKPRHAASVFVYNGALWMVAGNSMDKEVWKLTGAK